MNDDDFEKQKARVSAILTKWLDRLSGGWTINVHYYRGILPDTDGSNEANDDTLMKVKVRWEYCQASIYTNLERAIDHDDNYLNRICAHEAAHIAVHELRHTTDDWLKHEEHACTVIANMLIGTEKATKEATCPTSR